MNTYRQNKGFTLIELLVVVSIIGMLSSIVLSSLAVARAKGRDAKRTEDLHQIQTALELFRNDYGVYPACIDDTNSSDHAATITFGNSESGFTCPLKHLRLYNAPYTYLVPTYIPNMPDDPINTYPYGYYYFWTIKMSNTCDTGIASVHGAVIDASGNYLTCWTGQGSDYVLLTRLETKGVPYQNLHVTGVNSPGLNYMVGTN